MRPRLLNNLFLIGNNPEIADGQKITAKLVPT